MGLAVGLDGGGGDGVGGRLGRLCDRGDLGGRLDGRCDRGSSDFGGRLDERGRLDGRGHLGSGHDGRAGSLVGRGLRVAVGGRSTLARRAGRTRRDATPTRRRRRLVHSGVRHAGAVRAGGSGLGQRELRSGPPAWRSLIAAIRSPLRIFAVSAMFSSPASWRNSASTMVLRPLRHGGGRAARGVRSARLGRGTGGDEISLAHEGPS